MIARALAVAAAGICAALAVMPARADEAAQKAAAVGESIYLR